MESKLRSARENQELAIEILELLNQRVVKSDVIERIVELVRSSTVLKLLVFAFAKATISLIL